MFQIQAMLEPFEGFEDDEDGAVARYKAGMRQRALFEKTVNRILTRETLKYHDSSFQDQTLFPDRDVASWLAERRPTVMARAW